MNVVVGSCRILIVDWDVHHGQGIQYAFDDDPRFVNRLFLEMLQQTRKLHEFQNVYQ